MQSLECFTQPHWKGRAYSFSQTLLMHLLPTFLCLASSVVSYHCPNQIPVLWAPIYRTTRVFNMFCTAGTAWLNRSKVFDRFRNHSLFYQYIGISGQLFRLISSFLSNTLHQVILDLNVHNNWSLLLWFPITTLLQMSSVVLLFYELTMKLKVKTIYK